MKSPRVDLLPSPPVDVRTYCLYYITFRGSTCWRTSEQSTGWSQTPLWVESTQPFRFHPFQWNEIPCCSSTEARRKKGNCPESDATSPKCENLWLLLKSQHLAIRSPQLTLILTSAFLFFFFKESWAVLRAYLVQNLTPTVANQLLEAAGTVVWTANLILQVFV